MLLSIGFLVVNSLSLVGFPKQPEDNIESLLLLWKVEIVLMELLLDCSWALVCFLKQPEDNIETFYFLWKVEIVLVELI